MVKKGSEVLTVAYGGEVRRRDMIEDKSKWGQRVREFQGGE